MRWASWILETSDTQRGYTVDTEKERSVDSVIDRRGMYLQSCSTELGLLQKTDLCLRHGRRDVDTEGILDVVDSEGIHAVDPERIGSVYTEGICDVDASEILSMVMEGIFFMDIEGKCAMNM